MAENFPAAASSSSYQSGSGIPTPAAYSTGESGFERHYRIGAGGIGTFIAWGWAVLSVISFAASVSNAATYTTPVVIFHGISILTSMVSLTVFIILFVLHFRCGFASALSDNAKHFIVIAHSGFWGLCVFVSSCAVAGFGAVGGLAPSVAFGFFEAFALFGVVGMTVLHMMGHVQAPQIHLSNS